MDKSKAIDLLKQQLNEIPQLRELHHDNQEFRLWHNKVRDILKAALDTDDLKTFSSRQSILVGGIFKDDVYQKNYLDRLTDYETALRSIIQKYEMLGVPATSKAAVEESSTTADKLRELNDFYNELVKFINLAHRRLDGERLTKAENEQASSLHLSIERKVGYLSHLITELSGIEKVDVGGKEYDMWLIALRIPVDKLVASALGFCIQATNRAIGKLDNDIKNGIRDKKTGLLVTPQTKMTTEAPKAFIAHEGETRALDILKEYLEALGIRYFIAESKASDGRSVERQVDWTQSKADFAICLATKGKAVNKKTGKHYMAPNIIDELGRARQVFGNKIILLVQKGVEVHTNIREIVYETFTTTNMEKALIKVAKELTNWGFITAGTVKEQTS